jgi:MFS family permease
VRRGADLAPVGGTPGLAEEDIMAVTHPTHVGVVDRPVEHHPLPLLRPGPRLRAAFVLTAVLIGLMVVQAALGLVVDGLYPEEPWAVAALRGNDLVTLVLVAPLLAGATFLTGSRPSTASVVVWLGLLFYGVYNYAYYAFGAAFSDVFLLHVAALAVSVYALLMAGTSIDVRGVAEGVRGGGWARAVAVFTTLVGVALIGAWGTMSLRFAVTGELPQDVMPPSAVHLVYALDMAVLAPVFLLGGVLLWRRLPWGSVLAAAVNVSGAAYLTVLWFVGGFQANAGIEGKTWASPVAIGAVLLCLAAALVLLVPPRTGRHRAG